MNRFKQQFKKSKSLRVAVLKNNLRSKILQERAYLNRNHPYVIPMLKAINYVELARKKLNRTVTRLSEDIRFRPSTNLGVEAGIEALTIVDDEENIPTSNNKTFLSGLLGKFESFISRI